ncbi:MAG: DUF885 family protein [Verrucomicrobiales bacterium]|nr:DUF885 family protein [Verrucomicrobiales bacterium]
MASPFTHFRLGTLPLLTVLAWSSAPGAEPESMPGTVRHFSADWDLFSRHWSAAESSVEQMDAQKRLLESWLITLAAQKPDKLDVNDAIDAVLLKTTLDSGLNDLARQNEERAELAQWLPFRTAIEELTVTRLNGTPLKPEIAASKLATLPAQVYKLQDGIKAAIAKSKEPKKPGLSPAPSAYQAMRCAEIGKMQGDLLKRWFENQASFVPDFSWWVRQPFEETQKVLESYQKFLNEEIAGIKGDGDRPLIGKSIGAEELKRQLGYEFIPYSPEDLIGIAEREFAWCETQMKAAAQEMKLGDDWKAALKKVKEMHVEPGGQEALVREEAEKAITFVKDRKLVTVPPECEAWWGTRMLSAAEQKQMPYAAYSGHDIIIAFATTDMKQEDKTMAMRGNSRPFMHNVVPHELIPGHHLQRFMADRHRDYRGLFSTPFYVEGWSLYWEMRLWDLGYHKTPAEKIGALFWRMHRCARIIVTLKFHLGQMKPDEMVKFLTDRVGHEKFGATSEVRRFIKGDYSPLYQCGYMLGGLQLMALHKEAVTTGKMTELQFHDKILTLGPIPIELARAAVLGLPAPTESSWKFAEPAP